MVGIDAIKMESNGNGERKRVVAIIPAHNEEARIPAVIKVLKNLPLIDRLVVVDDGSVDKTSQAALNAGAEVIRLEKNKGKAGAMDEGVKSTNEEIILFLDADLQNLQTSHVIDLLEPVIKNETDMTMGVFKNGRFRTDIAHKISPGLSGQRAMSRKVWSLLDVNIPMEAVGYGIEEELQALVKEGKASLKIVTLKGVSQFTKEEKLGPQEGLKLRMKMYKDILKVWTRALKPRIQ